MGMFRPNVNDPHMSDIGWLANEPISTYAPFSFFPDYGGSRLKALTTMHRLGNLIYRLETTPVTPSYCPARWYITNLAPHLSSFTPEQRSYIQPLFNRLAQAMDRSVQLSGWTIERVNEIFAEESEKIDRMCDFAGKRSTDLLFGAALYTEIYISREPPSGTPLGDLSQYVSGHMWKQH